MEEIEFNLYKSLKKPLVFFGFKDKYIFYALGGILAGFVVGTILSTIIGFILSGGAIWYAQHLQKTIGLYAKTKNKGEIHIFPNRFKYKRKI